MDVVDSAGIMMYGNLGNFGDSGREVLITLLVSIILLIIIGVISRFDPGASTTAQRAWTMTWLVCDIIIGPVYSFLRPIFRDGIEDTEYDSCSTLTVTLGTALVFAAPAIGGLVVVGQMLVAYGNCIRIS